MKMLQCEQSMASSFSSSLLKELPSFRSGSLLTSSTSPMTLPSASSTGPISSERMSYPCSR